MVISPHPPTPPIFPYTTLFRSIRRVHQVHPHEMGDTPQFRHDANLAAGFVPRGQEVALQERLRHRCEHVAGIDRDRKSTRLNSSHVRISYAVFCVKKKKSSKLS